MDFSDFDPSTKLGASRDEVIKRALEAGIGMINIGVDLETSQKSIALAEKYDGVFAVVGIHPHDADKKIDFKELKKLAKHEKVVGIGECGLDNVRSSTSNIEQKDIFEQQIELALELDKPLMIHCRDAHKEVLEILKEYKNNEASLRCNIHFFSGNWEQAQEYLKLGFSLSFDGPITFSHDYDETIKNMPLGRIMAETDSPFAAPVPYRGQRNEPLYVQEVVKRIAEIKVISFEEAAKQTTKNAITFFGLE